MPEASLREGGIIKIKIIICVNTMVGEVKKQRKAPVVRILNSIHREGSTIGRGNGFTKNQLGCKPLFGSAWTKSGAADKTFLCLQYILHMLERYRYLRTLLSDHPKTSRH